MGVCDDKFTRKYMKLARTLAEDNDACYSRQIGVLIITDFNRGNTFGYNGPPEGVPHADTPEYLCHLYDDLLTEEDQSKILQNTSCSDRLSFVQKHADCRICPRKLLGCQSGERLDLCPCAHAERNALSAANRAGFSTQNGHMFCWCTLPCHECSIQIIQSGIKRVICLQGPDYSRSSRWLLNEAGVEITQVTEEWIDEING